VHIRPGESFCARRLELREKRLRVRGLRCRTILLEGRGVAGQRERARCSKWKTGNERATTQWILLNNITVTVGITVTAGS
jgi:hypothetical protein